MFTTGNISYVLLEIFMQFVAVKAKVWWHNTGSMGRPADKLITNQKLGQY